MLDANQRNAMKRYYENHQQSDGGWGTHIESEHHTMFDPDPDLCGLALVRRTGGSTTL